MTKEGDNGKKQQSPFNPIRFCLRCRIAHRWLLANWDALQLIRWLLWANIWLLVFFPPFSICQ
jgi:hypothetical protein